MAPRKRASSGHLREQQKRNVRPAKGRTTPKGRPEGSVSSSRRASSPILPPTITIGIDDNDDLDQQGSSTDVDEDQVEREDVEEYYGGKEDRWKGKGKPSKEARTMVLAARNSSTMTLVS